MPVVKFNATVQANADRVWQTLRQFGRISEWHPSIRSSGIEENQPDGLPGCKRRLVLDDGAVLREQLLMVDEGRQTFSYRFIESPLPVDNYVATVSLIPLSGRSETVIAWQASFEARSSDDAPKMEATVMALIASGHKSLAKFLENQ
ncbi:SRPBCC family protein [Enterobacter sp. UPMP2060]